MELCNFVQKVVIKTIEKKRCKKEKWLSEEVLQISKKREAKGRGERETYIQLNVKFQGRASRDKKAL